MNNESADCALQHRFHAQRRALVFEQAAAFDRDRDDLALDAVATMAQVLRTGRPDEGTLGLIAAFLDSLQADAATSTSKRNSALTIARRVLGYEPSQNPGKGVEEQRAIAVFSTYIGHGACEDDALVAAYNAYFVTQGRSYEMDREKGGQQFERGGHMVEGTVADKSMDELKSKLRRAGVLKAKPAGRKKRAT